MSFTLAVLTLALFLSPLGQSAVNSWLKKKFINDFDVELSVGALFINPVGITSFTDFLIRDHRNDTLIFVDYFEFESYHRREVSLEAHARKPNQKHQEPQ